MTSDADHDIDLLKQLRGPDMAARDAAARKIIEMVGPLCLVLSGGDWQRAQDLLQDTVVRAYQSYSTYEGRGRLRGWLGMIASRLSVDRARKTRRLREITLDGDHAVGSNHSLADDARAGDSSESTDPSLRSESAESGQELRSALAEMAEGQRRVLLMWAHGASYESIAQEVQIPTGTVGSKLSRAKSALKEIMERRAKAEP